MGVKKFKEKVMGNILSKKGMDSAHKTMSTGSSKTKKKYYKNGDIIGFIRALENKIDILVRTNSELRTEIAKLNKQLSKYNVTNSPNGVDAYIFFDQDEYNGLKHLQQNMTAVISDVKKEVMRKYWSSALAGYNKK